MKLTSVGFFRDLPYGNQSETSLKEAVSKFSGRNAEKIFSYLKSGVAFVVAPGISRDNLSDKREIIGSLALLTDGKFLWPSDLAYYFQKYKIYIPGEFIESMEENNWEVPAVDISLLEM